MNTNEVRSKKRQCNMTRRVWPTLYLIALFSGQSPLCYRSRIRFSRIL